MKSIKILFFFLFIPLTVINSQEDLPQVFYNDVYKPYIKTIKFHIRGLPLSYPIIDLTSKSQFELFFDDLDDVPKDYYYSVIHCNSDWTRSNLSEMEYLDGFNQEEITDFEFSFNTRIQFTNYYIQVPNNDTRLTKSGNYALVIYVDEGNGKEIAFIRRFMVVDPIFKVDPQLSRTADVGKYRTHHEIDFHVIHKNVPIRNPRIEVEAVVLQNGRWDTAVKGLRPRYLRNERMIFDFQDKVVFPALKEFRFLDLRSLEFRTEKVRKIDRYKDHWEVEVVPERSRAAAPYLFQDDINGNFIIENLDEPDDELTADYADVFFNLYTKQPLYDKDVYVFGLITDWKLRPEFKLTYDEVNSVYTGNIPLKQGFYNYIYAIRDVNNPDVVDYQTLEGNWYGAENEYTILVYYRPFGERYDRLVGAYTMNSAP